MDSSLSAVLAGMNLRNQILTIAINSIKAAAETIGFQGQQPNNRALRAADQPAPKHICPMIAESGLIRPDDCTPIEMLPVISMDTVAQHDHEDDCWIILYDLIYDLTTFIQEHPGGAEVLLEHAGRDGTMAFRGVGHSRQALLSMDKMVIGVLPEEERLYLKSTRSSLWSSLPGLIELQPEAL